QHLDRDGSRPEPGGRPERQRAGVGPGPHAPPGALRNHERPALRDRALSDPRLAAAQPTRREDRASPSRRSSSSALATASLTAIPVSGVTEIELMPHSTRKAGISSG